MFSLIVFLSSDEKDVAHFSQQLTYSSISSANQPKEPWTSSCTNQHKQLPPRPPCKTSRLPNLGPPIQAVLYLAILQTPTTTPLTGIGPPEAQNGTNQGTFRSRRPDITSSATLLIPMAARRVLELSADMNLNRSSSTLHDLRRLKTPDPYQKKKR